MDYYNDIELYPAEALKNLMGEIPEGVVDERDIADIRPEELSGFDWCNFFAGIAGWAVALDLAGWPRGISTWTGSCPCQPFSAAGLGAGLEDKRHVWPSWFHLIRECRPAIILGEQVASKAAEQWIDVVQADLEGVGYAFAGTAFPSASIGAQFIGDRFYWVAIDLAAPEWDQQPWKESCSREVGRVGRVKQSIPWDTPWQDALPVLRALDDGLPRRVGATDAARNAIVPAQAAEFIRSVMDILKIEARP